MLNIEKGSNAKTTKPGHKEHRALQGLISLNTLCFEVKCSLTIPSLQFEY